MLKIENSPRIFQNEVLRGSITKQLLFSGILSSLGVVLFTPIQAFSVGCGFTATLIAYQEYCDYRQFRAAPIVAPSGRFNLATLEKINHIEPWARSLSYCQAAMNLCGVVYLLTHVLITPGIMMAAIAGGSVIRILHAPKKQVLLNHEWVSVGIAGLAAECFKYSANPIGFCILSAAIGYFGTGFLIRLGTTIH